MMGHWQDNDIPTLEQTNKRQASASPEQGVSDTSLLSIDVPVLADHKIAMADRQSIKLVSDCRVVISQFLKNRLQSFLSSSNS
jgi:hypothetical protein